MLTKSKKRNAFTLVELLVVIAIIGILVAITARRYKRHGRLRDGHRAKTTFDNSAWQCTTLSITRKVLPTSVRPQGLTQAPRISRHHTTVAIF